MKKIKKWLVLFVIVLPLCVVLAGCSLAGRNGRDGNNGLDSNEFWSLINSAWGSLSAETRLEEYDDDILRFIAEYFRGEKGENGNALQTASSIAARSAVSIVARVYNASGYLTTAAGSAGAGVIYYLGTSTVGGAEVLNGNAFIITNYHVISDWTTMKVGSNTVNGLQVASEIDIYLYGMPYLALPASVVGGSPEYDVAVLEIVGNDEINNKLDSTDNRTVKEVFQKYADVISVGADICAGGTYDIRNVRREPILGQQVIAVGNPLGVGMSVTEGIVSVETEYITMKNLEQNKPNLECRVFRVSSAINPGNSGGGVFNSKGELLGLVSARTFKGPKPDELPIESMGYAIPLEIVVRVADQVIARKTESRPVRAKNAEFGIVTKSGELTTEYKTDAYGNGAIKIIETVIFDKINSLVTTNYKYNSTSADLRFMQGDIITNVIIYRPGMANTIQNNYTVTREYQIADFLIDAYGANQHVSFLVDRAGTAAPIEIRIIPK